MLRSLCLPCLLLVAVLPAQNRDHPGLVHLGGGKWGTREEAAAKSLIEYRGRWLPKTMQKQLEAWEREDSKSASWSDARRTESKHYRITTNVPRFVVELEIKPYLDELFRTYVKVFREDFGVTAKSANKNFIKIYHGYEDYARNEAENGQPVPRTTPGFFRGGDELVSFYDETDPAEFYGTIFHEGAHQFASAALPGATFPPWIEEGLATYFEGCTYSRATGKATLGYLPPDRLVHAQELLRTAQVAGRVSAQELFMDVPPPSFEADHYALAWSFVYYLIHRDGGAKRPAFARFLREMNGSGTRPVAEVFKRATREDLTAAERGWPEFVLREKPKPLPEWLVLGVHDPDPAVDLRDGDELFSIDGVEVYGEAQFATLWGKRARDRAIDVVVYRRVPMPAPVAYRREFVRATVGSQCKVELQCKAAFARAFQLSD